jgi:hypothetical protein
MHSVSYFCPILTKLEISRQTVETPPKKKSRKTAQWEPICSVGTDRRTDATKLVTFRNFAETLRSLCHFSQIYRDATKLMSLFATLPRRYETYVTFRNFAETLRNLCHFSQFCRDATKLMSLLATLPRRYETCATFRNFAETLRSVCHFSQLCRDATKLMSLFATLPKCLKQCC